MQQDYGLTALGSHNTSRTIHEKHITRHFAGADRESSIDDTPESRIFTHSSQRAYSATQLDKALQLSIVNHTH